MPERADMLAEAVASVRAQTLAPAIHLVGIDHARRGIGRTLNALARGTDADWLARLDDDDLFDPNHLEVLASATDRGDIIYTWCRVEARAVGRDMPSPPSVLGPAGWVPNQPFDADMLRERNYIPATTLIRRSLWETLGGWRLPGFGVADLPPDPHSTEDWEFWLRALDAGATFECIPQVTWTYRYHGGNVWLR
jgi:hypothetical protein